jgi:CRP-like cAMP-binding protein
MIETHLKKLRQRVDISAEEEREIRDLVSETRRVQADQIIVHAGQRLENSLMLIDGWLARHKDMPGGERQITEVHVAGDFADLHAFTLKKLDHDVISLTECTLAIIPHERLLGLFERMPRLARVYWFLTNVDAAVHREQILSLGRRPAMARMAHLFLELYLRLECVGRASGDRFAFPLTQRELSECLGLTVVHVNRTLQELRRRQLVQVEGREVRIMDRAALEGLAEFDPLYLYLDKQDL